jgi:hypothetical protein
MRLIFNEKLQATQKRNGLKTKKAASLRARHYDGEWNCS